MKFNGLDIDKIMFNGQEITRGIFNGESAYDAYLRSFVGDGNAYISLDSPIAISGDFEFRAVIKPSKASQYTDCILMGDAANTSFFRIATGNKLQTQINNQYREITLSESIADNVAINLTLRRLGGYLYVYKNKTLLVKSDIYTGDFTIDRLMFKGGAANVFWGNMADARFYDANDTIIHRYLLDEESGTTVHDSIGNINGAVVNTYAGVWVETTIPKSTSIQPSKDVYLFGSDIHMNTWDAIEGTGGLISTQRFDLFVEKINVENPKIAFIVGDTNENDVTLPQGNDQNPAVKAKLDNLAMPYKWIHGSHDFYNDEQWLALLGYQKNYSFMDGNIAFICVDNFGDYENIVPTSGYGYKVVDTTWLTNELDKYSTAEAIFVICHYLSDSESTIGSLLASYSNCMGVIQGHVHSETVSSISGIVAYKDGHFSVTEGGVWNDTKPWGYRIIERNEMGIIRTYMVHPSHVYPTFTQAREIADMRYIKA